MDSWILCTQQHLSNISYCSELRDLCWHHDAPPGMSHAINHRQQAAQRPTPAQAAASQHFAVRCAACSAARRSSASERRTCV